MKVHDLLESGPEEHGGGIDVGFCDGDFATLELKCKVLVETDAEEYTETVGAVFNEGFG